MSDDLLGVATTVAGWATSDEQVEAYAVRSRTSEVKAFGGDVESVTSADSEGIGIRVVTGGRQGFAYSASLDDGAVKTALLDARDNAEFATRDEFAALADPDGVDFADLHLHRPGLGALAMADKVEMALELERAVRAADPRVRGVESAVYGDSESHTAIASSAGVQASSSRTRCWLVADAIAGEGTDSQTGYGYSIGREPADLDLAWVAADAARRATRLLGASKPESRRVTAVFEPRVTASLLGVVAGPLNAEAVLKRRSLFADRMDETVGSPLVTLVDDPTDARASGAGAHDAEGLATRRNVLIERGRVAGFLDNAYTARRRGIPSNACAVRGGFKTTPGAGSRALALAAGTATAEEIWATVGDGLVITAVHGLHSGVNPVSGDISVGIEGFVIRAGALAEPVREATVATTIPRLLAGVVAVGGDVEWGLGGAAGVTVAVEDVTLSGR